jgi:hypothetical protein
MIAKHIDRTVRGLQWPIVYCMAALSPLILATLALWLGRSTSYPLYATMFWIGAAATFALSRSSWVSSKILTKAIGYERRITQAILSLLLLQPTSAILGWVRTRLGFEKQSQATSSQPTKTSGPATAWLAEDNWLIGTSSYFLPSASIVLWLLSALLLPAFLRSFILGVGVAYHILSVYFQIRHSEPTKLDRQHPKRFLWLFLIPVNLLVFIAGYAFALDGFSGLQKLPSDLMTPIWLLMPNSTAR